MALRTRSPRRTLLAPALLAVSAATAYAQPVVGTMPAPAAVGTSVLASPAGRFVFGQVGTYRNDQYLLDTQSGRMWVVVCLRGEGAVCEQVGLRPVLVMDANGTVSGVSPPVGAAGR